MHTERVAALKAFHEESRAQRPEELPVDLAAELQIAGVDRVAIEYRRWLREIAKGSDAAAKPPSNDVGTGHPSLPQRRGRDNLAGAALSAGCWH